MPPAGPRRIREYNREYNREYKLAATYDAVAERT